MTLESNSNLSSQNNLETSSKSIENDVWALVKSLKTKPTPSESSLESHLIVIGGKASGKTSLIHRFLDKSKRKSAYLQMKLATLLSRLNIHLRDGKKADLVLSRIFVTFGN